MGSGSISRAGAQTWADRVDREIEPDPNSLPSEFDSTVSPVAAAP